MPRRPRDGYEINHSPHLFTIMNTQDIKTPDTVPHLEEEEVKDVQEASVSPSPPELEQHAQPEESTEESPEAQPPAEPESKKNYPPSLSHLYESDDPALRPVPEGELPSLKNIYPVELKEDEKAGNALQEKLERGSRRSDLNQYWDKVLTGRLETIPEPIRQATGGQDKSRSPEENDEQLLRTINQSWAADHLGKPRQEVKEKWVEIREALSEDRMISSDEEELFYSLSDDQEKTKYQDIAYDLYDKGFEQGLTSDSPQAWNDYLTKEKAGIDSSKHEIMDSYAQSAFQKGADLRAKLHPIALTLSEGIEMMVSSEHRIFSPEQIVDSAASAQQAASQLRRLSKEERKMVYHLCLLERQKHQKGAAKQDIATQLWRSAKRGGQNVGFNLGLGVMHLGSAAMDSAGKLLDEQLGTELQGSAENIDLRARVAHEIRNLAQQQVAPLYIPEDTPLAEQFLIDMTGVVPSAAMGFGGALAWGSLIGSGVGASVSEARERNAEGDIALQNAAGLIAAGIQEAISFGFTRVGGRVFEKSLSQFIKAKGKGTRAYSLAALRSSGIASAETVKMALEQKAGNLSDLGLHELAAQIDKTNSNIDWKSYGENLGDIELNMREAAMNLPYLLIGAGRAQLQHFENAHALKNNPVILESWGIPDASIERIMNEEKLPRANEILREALLDSSRWGGAEFAKKAKQSLQLLNEDYFKNFSDDEVVADFLELPSSVKNIPKSNPIGITSNEPPDIEALQKKHGPIQGSNLRLGKALQFWDYMWERSNLDRHLPKRLQKSSATVRTAYIHRVLRERHNRRLTNYREGVPTVPLRLYRGFFNPTAEKERRLLLSDHVAELRDTSYQFILNINPVDYVMRDAQSLKAIVSKREKVRRRHIMRVASEVIHRALGRSKEESVKSIRWQFNEFYRHYRTYSIMGRWAKEVDVYRFKNLEEYALYTPKQIKKINLPDEFFQAAHTLFGMERSVDAFYEIIPQMDDFQRLIALGKTPAQAYSDILCRELEIDPAEFREYPLKLINQDAKKTELSKIKENNSRTFTQYEKITGVKMIQAEGAEGGTFWRTRLPDHSYTRWHANKEKAEMDLVMSTFSLFRPLGENIHEHFVHNEEFNLENYLLDEPNQYSAFDIISAQAFADIYSQHVMAVATGLPGLEYKRIKQRIGKNHSQKLLEFTPIDDSLTYMRKFSMDELSTSSPYSLLRARSYAYWKSQLNINVNDIHGMADELVALQVISPKQRQVIFLDAQPGTPERRMNQTQKILAPDHKDYQRLSKRQQEDMALALTNLSMDYLVATADEQPLPNSFKTWLRLSALCPLEENVEVPKKVVLGKNRFNLLRWTNRQIAMRLQLRGDVYADIRGRREQVEQSYLMPHLLASLGLSKNDNYERAWSHYFGGEHVIKAQDEKLWSLLVMPRQVWDRTWPSTKDWIYESISENYGILDDRESLYRSREHFDQSLYMLDDVLRDYPELHRVNLLPEEDNRIISLDLDDRSKTSELLAEARFNPIPWSIPNDVNEGYQFGGAVTLPDYLMKDVRVMPSLRLLHDLRLFNSRRAILDESGIWWDGNHYGVDHELLPGLGDQWSAERPLASMLPIIDEIQDRIATEGEGKELQFMDITFKPIDEQLDLSPLRHAVVYRDEYFPSHTIRLMPGHAMADSPTLRAPFFCEVRSGVYFHKKRHIPDPSLSETEPIYTNLNFYHPYQIRDHNERRHQETSQATSRYLVERVMKGLDNPEFAERLEQGEADVENLLVELYEDSGLSYDLTTKSLDDLTPAQLTVLRICYGMAQLAYGTKKSAAYKDLISFMRKLKKKPQGLERLALNLYDILERQNRQSKQEHDKAIRDGLLIEKNKPGRRPTPKDTRNLKKKYEQGAHWYNLGI